MSGLCIQDDHVELIKTSENLREEVRKRVSTNANLTGELLAARSEISLMKKEIDRVEQHAKLAESTKKLDQDEVKRLQSDLDTMQGVHMEDTKHLRELDLKLKVLAMSTAPHHILLKRNLKLTRPKCKLAATGADSLFT